MNVTERSEYSEHIADTAPSIAFFDQEVAERAAGTIAVHRWE